MLLELGERTDVVDTFVAVVSAPFGVDVSATEAQQLLAVSCSPVVHLPSSLPILTGIDAKWATTPFRLASVPPALQAALEVLQRRPQRRSLVHVCGVCCLLLTLLSGRGRVQDYKRWASNAIQLDRHGQAQHADATVHKTVEAVMRMLGAAHNVLGKAVVQPCFDLLLDGELVASYTSFSLDTRCVRGAVRCAVRWCAVQAAGC